MSAPRGAVPQKDGKSYAIIPKLNLGLIDAATLRKLADVIDKYNVPVTKVTGSMRLALVGMKADDVEAIWNDLGLEPAPAVGSCVRSVQSCPGTAVCKNGLQDSLGLGSALDEKYSGKPMPGTVKIAVSGCPICCAESYVRDLGFVGRANGWTVVVGGYSSRNARIGDVLAEGLTQDDALKLAEKVIAVYTEQAKPGERIGKMIDRLNFETFKKLVL